MRARSDLRSKKPVPLPTPEQRPDADIVIFDGRCPFCRRQVQRLRRWDWRRRLAFLPRDAPEVARRWPELTPQQLVQQMYVVDQHGHKRAGAMAVRYLARQLPPLWPLAPWLHLPGTAHLWQALYGWVARHRYTLLSRRGQCLEGAACGAETPSHDSADQRK